MTRRKGARDDTGTDVRLPSRGRRAVRTLVWFLALLATVGLALVVARSPMGPIVQPILEIVILFGVAATAIGFGVNLVGLVMHFLLFGLHYDET